MEPKRSRGTYVLFVDGAGTGGWEILPELTGTDPYKTTGKAIPLAGGEVRFARRYLSGFELNQWLADTTPGYVVKSSSGVLRIEHGDDATDFTLDRATNLPLTSASVSLADPDRPMPSETRFTEWRSAGGVRFPMQRVKYVSGVKRGEVITEDLRVNAGLRTEGLAATPANFAPDLPGR